jgi:hypothetical protein
MMKTFQQAGVLGQSEFGPDVRGHGSCLLDPIKDPLNTNPNCAPGGVFSSGLQLDVRDAGSGPGTQDISKKNSPQLRLVPFEGGQIAKFPEQGMIGDLFCTFNVDGDRAPNPIAQLFICLHINSVTKKPIWSLVVCTGGTDGGQPIL